MLTIYKAMIFVISQSASMKILCHYQRFCRHNSEGSYQLWFSKYRNTKNSQSRRMSVDTPEFPNNSSIKLQKVINIRNVVPFSMDHIPNALIYRSACISSASKPDVSFEKMLYR